VRCRRPSRQARPWQRTPREPVATPGTARATAAMGPRRTARTYARRRSPAHGTPGPRPPWLPGTTPDNTVGATRGVNPQCPAGKQFQGTAFPETDPDRWTVGLLATGIVRAAPTSLSHPVNFWVRRDPPEASTSVNTGQPGGSFQSGHSLSALSTSCNRFASSLSAFRIS
jgi:hypothetical protein